MVLTDAQGDGCFLAADVVSPIRAPTCPTKPCTARLWRSSVGVVGAEPSIICHLGVRDHDVERGSARGVALKHQCGRFQARLSAKVVRSFGSLALPFRPQRQKRLALFVLLVTMAVRMRRLFCLAAIAMSGCSADPLGAHDPLNGRLVENGGSAEQTNYPPETLKEQTFVLSNPVAYQSKRDATSDDIRIASKLAAKIVQSTGKRGLIAVPVSSAQGTTTTADVMVYDTARNTLVNDTVYRFGYTPPAGQTLQLDSISAVFATRGE